MSQRRYARIDVEFMTKRTANALWDKLGPCGPLVFLALILAAKDGHPPGSFTYPNDAIGWQKLGLDGRDIPFTLDEFFTATGRLKQTSRRRHGRVWHAYLTRYTEWQKDSRRYEEAVRKSSKRRESTEDTERTQRGTRSGRKGGPRTRTRTTPLPPEKKNGKADNPCPICGTRGYPKPWTDEQLAEHLAHGHDIVPDQQAAA